MDAQKLRDCEILFSKMADFEQEAKPAYNKENYSKVIREVINAIVQKHRIKTVGDKDVDGVFSSLSLWKYLQMVAETLHGEEGRELMTHFHTTRESGFGMLEKDFNKWVEEGVDLIICTDQGSSLQYIKDDTTNLVILDHHPVDASELAVRGVETLPWFVLSPNVNRPDDVEYSTSAGAVVDLFMDNLELNLNTLIPEYTRAKEIEIQRQKNGEIAESSFVIKRKLFKAMNAITLISDMAIMDKKHRAMVNNAMHFFSKNPTILPFIGDFEGDFTQRKASFSVISNGNTPNRMDGRMDCLTEYIVPRTMDEYTKGKEELDALQGAKKKAVAKHFELFNKTKSDSNEGIYCYFGKDMSIGLSGLIANKISTSQNLAPTFVVALKKNGDISGSARGENCKKVVLDFISSSKQWNGGGGGHDNAMGFSFQKREEDKDNASAVLEFFEDFKKNYNKELLGEITKKETPFVDTVSLEEFFKIRELYMDYAGSAEFYKKIYIAVSDFKEEGMVEHKFPWASIHLKDKNSSSKTKDTILVDLNVVPKKYLLNGDNNASLLIELVGNGDISIVGAGEKEDILSKLKLATELEKDKGTGESIEESIEEEEAPTIEEEAPTIEEEAPTIEEEAPTIEEETPKKDTPKKAPVATPAPTLF